MAQQLVVFRVAGEAYALPVSAVREVVGSAARRRLPSPPAPWVVGVASVRGELMPVVDLALRMGGARPGEEAQVLVVVTHRGRTVALAVEDVDRIVEVPGRLPRAPAYAGDAAASITEVGEELIVVLRPAALLPPA